jgi:predicted nuclease of predicted toxin-antitoxin system
MKFLLDMNLSRQSAAHLRGQGHDAVHLFEQRLERLADHDIILKACSEKRILVTHDLDFGEILAASGDHLPSVITFRLRNMQPDNVNRHLDAIIANHHEALAQGVLMSVTEGQIRMRHLPIR